MGANQTELSAHRVYRLRSLGLDATSRACYPSPELVAVPPDLATTSKSVLSPPKLYHRLQSLLSPLESLLPPPEFATSSRVCCHRCQSVEGIPYSGLPDFSGSPSSGDLKAELFIVYWPCFRSGFCSRSLLSWPVEPSRELMSLGSINVSPERP